MPKIRELSLQQGLKSLEKWVLDSYPAPANKPAPAINKIYWRLNRRVFRNNLYISSQNDF